MTKKHFIALADAVRQAQGIGTPSTADLYVRRWLADFCQSQNGNFNRERWLAYINGECGANGGTISAPRHPREVKPERKLAQRLEGKRDANGQLV